MATTLRQSASSSALGGRQVCWQRGGGVAVDPPLLIKSVFNIIKGVPASFHLRRSDPVQEPPVNVLAGPPTSARALAGLITSATHYYTAR